LRIEDFELGNLRSGLFSPRKAGCWVGVQGFRLAALGKFWLSGARNLLRVDHSEEILYKNSFNLQLSGNEVYYISF
jgi:hypothetical protein